MLEEGGLEGERERERGLFMVRSPVQFAFMSGWFEMNQLFRFWDFSWAGAVAAAAAAAGSWVVAVGSFRLIITRKMSDLRGAYEETVGNYVISGTDFPPLISFSF